MSRRNRTRSMLAAWALLVIVAALAVVLTRQGSAQPGGGSAPPPKPLGPELLLDVPWGQSGASLGRLDAQEGASEGPMSFAVLPSGELLVLDQVQQRLARFDSAGQLRAAIPLPATTFQELDVTEDGHIVVLDRLVRASLLVLSPSGQPIREVGVIGDGIPEGGGITAMLTARDGVWLELDHTNLVRVLDGMLSPSARTVVRGRPYDPNAHLVAAIDRQGGASLWLEDAVSGNVRQRVDVQTVHSIDRIIWIETDRSGSVHAMVHWMDWDPAQPTILLAEGVLGLRFDSTLREVARYASPHVIVELEQFREFRVMPDGTVYQMAFSDAGVRFLRWRWVP